MCDKMIRWVYGIALTFAVKAVKSKSILIIQPKAPSIAATIIGVHIFRDFSCVSKIPSILETRSPISIILSVLVIAFPFSFFTVLSEY